MPTIPFFRSIAAPPHDAISYRRIPTEGKGISSATIPKFAPICLSAVNGLETKDQIALHEQANNMAQRIPLPSYGSFLPENGLFQDHTID